MRAEQTHVRNATSALPSGEPDQWRWFDQVRRHHGVVLPVEHRREFQSLLPASVTSKQAEVSAKKIGRRLRFHDGLDRMDCWGRLVAELKTTDVNSRLRYVERWIENHPTYSKRRQTDAEELHRSCFSRPHDLLDGLGGQPADVWSGEARNVLGDWSWTRPPGSPEPSYDDILNAWQARQTPDAAAHAVVPADDPEGGCGGNDFEYLADQDVSPDGVPEDASFAVPGDYIRYMQETIVFLDRIYQQQFTADVAGGFRR